MISRYQDELCPFCEKPQAGIEVENEYNERWIAAERYDDDPALIAWSDQYCWSGWYQSVVPCGPKIEDRLMQVLDQRDAARQHIAILEQVIRTVIQIVIGD